jgi:hypothetical protein
VTAARCAIWRWEATSTFGVRRSFPFINRESLELAFSCHPSELIGPGTKKTLRAALADDVPAENLQRPDKGIRFDYPEGECSWSVPLPDALQSVVRQEWFPRPPARISHWDAIQLTTLVKLAQGIERARKHRGSATVPRREVAAR